MQCVCGVARRYNNKKIYGRGVRPRFSQLLHLKNKIFFRKELGRSALSYAKDYSGRRYAPPSTIFSKNWRNFRGKKSFKNLFIW